MKRSSSIVLTLFLLTLTGITIGSPLADPDWPQWQGPDRTNISKETGLLKQWPASGPPVAWAISGIGEGYGSVSIKGAQIFVQGAKNNQSVLFCLNRADGKTLWTAPIGKRGSQDRGNGPRGTPTVDEDRVYVLTERGDLACVSAKNGSVVWTKNILTDFGGGNPQWLLSESPLVDGANVIITPGGQDAGLVALDKMTGKLIWRTKGLSDGAGYSSCVVADVHGVRTIMTLTAEAAVGVRANDGKLMWRYRRVANNVANVATPIYSDNKVFYTSAYDTGCALLDLTANGAEVSAKEVYFSRDMQNHHGGVVLINGYLYGFSNSILTCLDFATGKVVWRDRSVGKGSLTYADGNLYLLGENNTAGLAEATPEGYKEKGKFHVADQGWPSWAHPVVCGGKLYIRNQGTLTCYDVKAK